MKIDAKKKKILGFIAVFELLILLPSFGIKLPRFMYLNVTESLPLGIYLKIPGTGLRNGDIVAFRNSPDIEKLIIERDYFPEHFGRPIMLKHAAVEGTPYMIGTDRTVMVQNRYIGLMKASDSQGRPVPQQHPGKYIVPVGYFLPYTTAANSFDGRYYGPIEKENIEARVIPLFTW